MRSTRRSFLGLLGGGAAAGPVTVKQALSQVPQSTGIGCVERVAGNAVCSEPTDHGEWLAKHVLDLMEARTGPAKTENFSPVYADIEALVSVSRTSKVRMTNEKEKQERIGSALRDFISHHKLNWLGMSEKEIFDYVELIARQPNTK